MKHARAVDAECVLTTRRRFLATLGAGAAVAVGGTWGMSVWSRDPAFAGLTLPAATYGIDTPNRTLVVIEMGGGNDGLNMVVPYADNRYHDLRGDLAISDPLPLDDHVGLHPALTNIAMKYSAGDVAIVEGVGYESPDLSHFSSMSTWWSGQQGSAGRTGWLGRYLDAAVGGDEPLAAVTIGPGPSPALLGERSFQVAIQDVSGLSPNVPPWIDDKVELMAMWTGFANPSLDAPDLAALVDVAIAGSAGAADTLQSILEGVGAQTDRAPGPTGLGEYLQLAARLITSSEQPRVIYVHGWGDFDTHQGQLNRQGAMMEQLDAAIGSFWETLEIAEAADRALIMTTSEFGRRAASNGSGTDHGTASCALLLGPAVVGGRHGEPPSLSRLDTRGTLVHTVDYRSIYTSVLDYWLGADATEVLGASVERIGLLRPEDPKVASPFVH